MEGFVDSVSRRRIAGWARDPDQPATRLWLQVEVDGTPVLRVLAAGYRADLAQAGMGDGCYAFDATFHPPLPAGAQQVAVTTEDGTKLPGSPIQLTPPEGAPRLIGDLDRVERELVEGWAQDPADPDTPLELEILVDDAPVGRVLANVYRADLEEAGLGSGRHGFRFAFAPPLSSLRHVFAVREVIQATPVPRSPVVLAADRRFDATVRAEIAAIMDGAETMDGIRARLGFLADQAARLFARQSERASRRSERLAARQHRRRWGGSAPERPAAFGPRALIVDLTMPRLDRDAGSVAIVSHATALLRIGYEVVFAAADMRAEGAAALDALGLTCCHAPWFGSVEEVLRTQGDSFDLIYLHRIECAFDYLALARRHAPRARIVYAVADLHHVRFARQAEVEQRPELRETARRLRNQEFWGAMAADAVITHSPVEAALLTRALPQAKVHVVPWVVTPRPSAPAWLLRNGVAFIGHYPHAPNLDAALWLSEDIVPLLEGVPCLLVGSQMPEVLRQPRPGVEPVGSLPDLTPIYDRVRLTVAPLLFGAGVKGKVLHSLAAGIPCVCTPIAAEGIPLGPALQSLVAADAPGIAAAIRRVHDDRSLWEACRAEGLALIAQHYTPAEVEAALRQAVR